jgi:spore germination cell wall hydrolase CwlJ-like protein
MVDEVLHVRVIGDSDASAGRHGEAPRRPVDGGHGATIAILALVGLGVAIAALPRPTVIAATAIEPAHPRVPAALLSPPGAVADTLAAAEPLRLQNLTEGEARAWNASYPVSISPNPVAGPFRFSPAAATDRSRAVDCLASAIYYEAGRESVEGQRAVAQVVLNRVRHPAYPKTVCGVVFQGAGLPTGCQFTFTCDGALSRAPSAAGWAEARKVAAAALDGYVMRQVGYATHYHAVYVAPYWSPSLIKVANIGEHIFYRWAGAWGLPETFVASYGGGEPAVAPASSDLQPATAVLTAQEPAAEPARAEPVQEATPVSAEAEPVVRPPTSAELAALLPPEKLDWAGRPRIAATPRLPRPSPGAAF